MTREASTGTAMAVVTFGAAVYFGVAQTRLAADGTNGDRSWWWPTDWLLVPVLIALVGIFLLLEPPTRRWRAKRAAQRDAPRPPQRPLPKDPGRFALQMPYVETDSGQTFIKVEHSTQNSEAGATRPAGWRIEVRSPDGRTYTADDRHDEHRSFRGVAVRFPADFPGATFMPEGAYEATFTQHTFGQSTGKRGPDAQSDTRAWTLRDGWTSPA